MRYYAYDEFVKDTKKLLELSKAYEADTLLAIARGGLTLAHAYAIATDNRRLFSINSVLYEKEQKGNECQVFNLPDLSKAKKVLILDDIVDSGETIRAILSLLQENFPQVEFKVAALFYKPTALMQPDFAVNEAKEWIEFFWEKDVLDKES